MDLLQSLQVSWNGWQPFLNFWASQYSDDRMISVSGTGTTWFPRRQPRSVRLAVHVPSADSVFVTVIVHFQVVGHLLAAFAVTQHGRVQRMLKLEEFHAQDFTATEYTAQAVQIG